MSETRRLFHSLCIGANNDVAIVGEKRRNERGDAKWNNEVRGAANGVTTLKLHLATAKRCKLALLDQLTFEAHCSFRDVKDSSSFPTSSSTNPCTPDNSTPIRWQLIMRDVHPLGCRVWPRS